MVPKKGALLSLVALAAMFSVGVGPSAMPTIAESPRRRRDIGCGGYSRSDYTPRQPPPDEQAVIDAARAKRARKNDARIAAARKAPGQCVKCGEPMVPPNEWRYDVDLWCPVCDAPEFGAPR